MSETTVIHVREMQPGDVYIGRRNDAYGLKPSKWANAQKITPSCGREESIEKYETLIRALIADAPSFWDIDSLRGKRLACWCHPLPCHGDVLVKILAEREATR